MPVAATTAPSPGWYPDPNDADHLRWWDGHSWTEHVTDLPGRETEPFVADAGDFVGDDEDPIDFGWEDEADDFVLTFLEPEPAPASEPDPEPAAETAPEPSPFAFRVRAIDSQPAAVRRPDLPVYASPLETIASPLPARVETPPAAPEPTVHTFSAEGASERSEVGVRPSPVEPAAAEPEVAHPRPARSAVPRRALKGSVGLVVCAALAAQITNALRDDESPAPKSLPAATGITPADKSCLKEWNTTTSATAAELRVTLGQFTGAYARVGRVDPLPGTLMAPDSCALTVYDPATDTNVVFVSGVPDQLGYMDVTSYPRAKAYGWPKSATQSNVAVREDGTIAAVS